ncbi:PREDICTED: protein OBERON 3 [Fragaria vesca subsp. vesca]|uniref:protein OBERON 3 n=1 Tax=Fragaria vesca subsp. vesca TaxID=101020 RepID=UPI0002C36DA0|nr:PREDICTED: protein OBERON 3 [Fragaria vesca subsp. vesca]
MFGDKDRSNVLLAAGDEASQSKVTRHVSKQHNNNNNNNPEKKTGLNFLRGSDSDGFQSKSNFGSQELTLSYLCDNSKLGFLEKGKEIMVPENPSHDHKWVERDFLNLNESSRPNSSKRELGEDVERDNRDKKPKLETLNLSLALPQVSLSLTASNNGEPSMAIRPRSTAMAPSTNTLTTYSNDYTAASLSYSYSHPYSHNPSCSLTRNSTENFECSVGKDDQIWNCGEGTNGSVHSRFKPIGDGVGLANPGGILSMMQSNNTRMDSGTNSLYRTTSSDNNQSFFPSELPAKPRMDTHSGDSRGRGSESLRGLEGGDGRVRKLSRPERILREIVSESIPVMAQEVQKLPEETLSSTNEYLRNLIAMPEKKEEFVSLQKRLERRSDLTKENLSKCHRDQLEILVAVKMGLASFISGKNRLSATELMETFLFTRCRNVNCKSLLPVDDCDCKICSGNKGFCSSCMCPVCLNFDCASNTCSWVGCDVCSHWCHAACGIQKNLIRPGPSLKGPSGTTEMQFHCIGCGHASEMFGFVKDVFLCCAKDWGLETLVKELDCVKKIFRRSEDFKGRELHIKADEIISKLGSQVMSPSDACNFIIQFFNYTDGVSEYPASSITTSSTKELAAPQTSLRKEATLISQPASLPPKYAAYNTSSSVQSDLLSNDLRQIDLKSSLISTEDEFRFGTVPKIEGFDSLESMVRIKHAEAGMYQSKADEARREAEGYRQMIRENKEKVEEEYAGKLSGLSLKETEEKRRKKLEELKVLEGSHCDYYNMKTRMQAEIAGLLAKMEATKQQQRV